MPSKTQRQRIADIISFGPQTVEEIAEAVDAPVSAVLSDLEHVSKSYGDTFVIHPPRCRSCEFLFKGRTKIKRPSRCPECKEERIRGPWFEIKDEG